jgi:transcriptional adapter 2-alpha
VQLQEARKMGLTKLSEIATYEKDKANRATNKALGYSSLPYDKTSARSGSVRSKEESTTPPGRSGGAHRKTPNPLDISQAESYSLLLQGERDLCSNLRIYPKAYFLMKDILLRAYVSRGFLTPSMAKSLLKDVDPLKAVKVYEFFYEAGWVKPL